MWPFKVKITKEQALKEIQELHAAYRKEYPAACSPGGSGVPFLVGSSLVGNKNGDSQRYWELKKIIG